MHLVDRTMRLKHAHTGGNLVADFKLLKTRGSDHD